MAGDIGRNSPMVNSDGLFVMVKRPIATIAAEYRAVTFAAHAFAAAMA
jgi:hypothetical protein